MVMGGVGRGCIDSEVILLPTPPFLVGQRVATTERRQ
jgi:hypothetical protein